MLSWLADIQNTQPIAYGVVILSLVAASGLALGSVRVRGFSEIDLNFAVSRLGEGRFPSPISGARFVSDEERVLYHADMSTIKGYLEAGREAPYLKHINFFSPDGSLLFP